MYIYKVSETAGVVLANGVLVSWKPVNVEKKKLVSLDYVYRKKNNNLFILKSLIMKLKYIFQSCIHKRITTSIIIYIIIKLPEKQLKHSSPKSHRNTHYNTLTNTCKHNLKKIDRIIINYYIHLLSTCNIFT